MRKLNCWEVKKCGREVGGARKDLGVCAAAVEHRLHGVHGGKHGGRACWVVVGTLCGGTEQGTFAKKYHNCEKCDFYRSVKSEEGARFILAVMLLKKMSDAALKVPRRAVAPRPAAVTPGNEE